MGGRQPRLKFAVFPEGELQGFGHHVFLAALPLAQEGH
jgi:hypothetical protein